ncbi:MAG: RNA polymerase sigma factor [Firmicutes bacterium]|nr:RNA polymerase sigma factor [Bacillota bacterium]
MELLKTQPFSSFGPPSDFHEAFAALYPRLVSYAVRYGATYPEDLAQEAFVILMQREAPVEHPAAFLYGTVRTLALTERRPMKNRNLSLEGVSEQGQAAEADDLLLSAEVRERMRALSPTFREALWLFVVEGLSIKEIAGALAIPEATVKTRIHRAKAQLRELLNPSGGIHVLA